MITISKFAVLVILNTISISWGIFSTTLEESIKEKAKKPFFFKTIILSTITSFYVNGFMNVENQTHYVDQKKKIDCVFCRLIFLAKLSITKYIEEVRYT